MSDHCVYLVEHLNHSHTSDFEFLSEFSDEKSYAKVLSRRVFETQEDAEAYVAYKITKSFEFNGYKYRGVKFDEETGKLICNDLNKLIDMYKILHKDTLCFTITKMKVCEFGRPIQ